MRKEMPRGPVDTGYFTEVNMKQDIEILGKTYVVTYQNPDNMCGTMGSCNRERGFILIDNTLNTDQQNETLLHEIIHVIDGELKLNLDETTVARLAVGLYSAGYGKDKTARVEDVYRGYLQRDTRFETGNWNGSTTDNTNG